ncbi:MAG: RDD family protein [Actinomycetota bacterium]
MNQEEIKKEEEIIEEIKEAEEAVEEKVEEVAEEVKEVEEAVKEKVVGYKKADVFKRFVAYLIDAILASVVSLIPVVGGLVAGTYMLLRDGFDFMQNRSLGKMAVNLKPIVVETGANCDLQTSAKRNWPFAIGYFLVAIPVVGWIFAVLLCIPLLIYVIIEAVLVFTDEKGLRFGDKMAGTQVIEL